MINLLFQERLNHPLLFLYSRRDFQIPYQIIEHCAARQKSTGRQVETVDFRDSGHVAHRKMYPEMYSDKVERFVGNVTKLRTP